MVAADVSLATPEAVCQLQDVVHAADSRRVTVVAL
jgi:hypothetical protein